MKIQKNEHIGTVRRILSLAVALSALSQAAHAFQPDGPRTRPGQSAACDVQFPDGASIVEGPVR